MFLFELKIQQYGIHRYLPQMLVDGLYRVRVPGMLHTTRSTNILSGAHPRPGFDGSSYLCWVNVFDPQFLEEFMAAQHRYSTRSEEEHFSVLLPLCNLPVHVPR